MIASHTTAKKKSFAPGLVIILFILSSVLEGSSVLANEPKNQFVPGEVMIKFRPETEPDRLLSQAIRSNPPDIGILAPITRLLSDKIKIPLKFQQLLSGGWVLGEVDADKLIKRSVAQLAQRNRITDIRLKAGNSQTVDSPLPKEIDITFHPGSPEYKILAAKLAGHGEDRFTELIHELANSLDIPLQGSTDQQAHLILQLDLREVTIMMTERLRGLPEIIESAQLNYISTIMRPF